MKKITTVTLILIVLSLAWTSCEKIDVPKGTPRCITKKIKKKKGYCLDKVYQYEFNGATVYLFFSSSCFDIKQDLYNEDCDLICSPSGGMNGLGDGQCVNFYQEAINKKLIWSK